MEVPAWLCKEVHRIAPFARLAWAGERSKDPDELNPGGFAIVELARSSVVGSLDEPNIPQEIWHVTTRADKYGKATRCRIDRGPIFNRWGGTVPDWDLVEYVPIYVGRFKDYGLTDLAVWHGAVIPMLHRWETSRKDRVNRDRERKAKEVKQKIDEVSRDGADRLWHEASKTGSTTPMSTREERVQAHADILKKKADFDAYYQGKSRY